MAAAGAAVAALAVVTAAPAAAAPRAPAGRVVATEVPQPPVVDDEAGWIVYEVTPGVVRSLYSANGGHRDVDVSATCDRYENTPRVGAASDGDVLLWCAEERRSLDAYGREQLVTQRVARVLDGSDGIVKAPVNAVEADRGYDLDRGWIVVFVQERQGSWEYAVNWRTGARSAWGGGCDDWTSSSVKRGGRTAWQLTRCDGSEPSVLPQKPQIVEHGYASWSERGLDNTKRLTVYLPQCRVLARWQIGAIDVVEHLPGEALLIGAAAYGGAPLTERRVSLAGLCPRTTARWGGLVASARGQVTVPRLSGGELTDAATGATVSPLPGAVAAPQLRLRAGTPLRLTTAAPARGIRWRIDGGRWRVASGSGSVWTARPPARLRGRRTVEFETRRASGTTRHDLRLVLAGGKR